MRQWMTVPRRSLQTRILASVLLGLGFVVLGLAALVFKITDESTRYALAERLALATTIQQAVDREILAAHELARNLGTIATVHNDPDLRRFLSLADPLEAVTIVGPGGNLRVAAARHGVRQIRPDGALHRETASPIFAIPADPPTVGLAVPMAFRQLLLAQVNRARLLRLLAAHSVEATYMAEMIGPAGAQIALAPLPPRMAGSHLELVEPLIRHGEAGIVMHAVPDHRFDHYVAFAPLGTLPGWGVTLEQSRDAVVALPKRLRTLIFSVGLLTLIAGGFVAWLDVRRVVMPLRALAKEAERIGRGDLVTPIRVTARDEVSVLAESLDRMRAALDDSLKLVQRRETQARALHEVGTGILRSHEGASALDLVVGEARRLLAADVCLLCLYDVRTQVVRPTVIAGAAEAVEVRTALACPPREMIGCRVLAREYRVGHLVAPVQAGNVLLGWLCAGTKEPRTFTDDDRSLLESLGTLAALALENNRLRAEVQWLGTIQERERLARELHDGLAQALGVIHAYARPGDDVAARRRALTRIAEVSSKAYEEVRQAIYGLRLTRSTDLASALNEYLEEFTRQTGLPVEMVIEDRRATALALETEVQLVRIIQEALTNVWRHAHAARATVRFTVDEDAVVVSIEDDGVGFTPTEAARAGGHFGLLTMQERAESVGGRVMISSAPGGGTQVTARLPLSAREVASWIPSV